MTPDGQIAIPLDKAAIREPFLIIDFKRGEDPMTCIRRNVHRLGDDWADDILWYARAVKALKARPLAQNTSWLFYDGIHGAYGDLSRFVPGLDNLWEYYGIIDPTTPRPSQSDQDVYWNQCQHQSWYFLP